MKSLHRFCFTPGVAETLRLTGVALYQRQRILVDLDLLPHANGRGRGSGADATPETVTLLLAACLLTDNLSEVENGVRELVALPYVGKDTCPTTGAVTFGDAVAFLLTSNVAGWTQITFLRHQFCASIGVPQQRSYFGVAPSPQGIDRVEVVASLSGEALQTIKQSIFY